MTMTIPNFWLTNLRILCPNQTIHAKLNDSSSVGPVNVDFSEIEPRTLRLCVSVFSSCFSHRDGRRLQIFSRNFRRSGVTSHLNCILCLLLFGVRSAGLDLASRFLKFVRSRAFRNSANANATRGREVTPRINSDTVRHLNIRILGAKHSL